MFVLSAWKHIKTTNCTYGQSGQVEKDVLIELSSKFLARQRLIIDCMFHEKEEQACMGVAFQRIWFS